MKQLHIEKSLRKDANKGWWDNEGFFHESAADFIQTEMNLCSCGRPEESLMFMARVLRFLKNGWNREQESVIFPVDGSAYFTYYMFDLLGLTEHGGAVPGWLTAKGSELMEDVEVLFEEYGQENWG